MDDKFKTENKIFIKDNKMADSLNDIQIKAMVEIKKYLDEKYKESNKIIIEKDTIKIINDKE